MTSSFAAFASQMLQRPGQPSASAITEENPMFFSFVSDTSRGRGRDINSREFEDEDDPHLMGMGDIDDEEEQDPFIPQAHGSRQVAHDEYESSDDEDASGGWLAHQGHSPAPRVLPTAKSSHLDRSIRPPPRQHIDMHESLTDSLLPSRSLLPAASPLVPPRAQDEEAGFGAGFLAALISLTPSPSFHPRRRMAYQDTPMLTIYLSSLTLSLILSLVLLFNTPPHPSTYRALLHMIPLITVLTFGAAAVSYAQLWALGMWGREVVVLSAGMVPAGLAVCTIWAFVGSFGEGGGWGMRILSLVFALGTLWTGRNLRHLPREIRATTLVLALITRFLKANAQLLVVSPALLLAALVASIPFLTILFRLELHEQRHFVVLTSLVWAWTWAVARGVLRVAVSATLARRSLEVSLQSSLGSIALASLILTLLRALSLITAGLVRLPLYVSSPIVVRSVHFTVGYLEGISGTLSRYALVYVGLTGDAFFPSARKSAALNASAPSVLRPPTLNLLLTAPITLPLPAFLLLYFVFSGSGEAGNGTAWQIALLGSGVVCATAWVCVALVRDVADAFWLVCLVEEEERIQVEGGKDWIKEIRDAFEYKPTSAHPPARAFAYPEPTATDTPTPAQRTLYPQPSPYRPPPPAPAPAASTLDIDPFETSYTAPQPSRYPLSESSHTSSSQHSRHSSSTSSSKREERLPDSDSDSDEREDEEGLFGLGGGSIGGLFGSQ